MSGFCAAASAADKKPLQIPAQKLESALRALAKERGLQMVYRSEVIGELRTQGVSGDLTAEEALAIVDTWLNTPFEGGRHENRVQKISALEN